MERLTQKDQHGNIYSSTDGGTRSNIHMGPDIDRLYEFEQNNQTPAEQAAMIAEVATLRRDIRQLREAIAVKGGDENYPTEEAYLKACDALKKQHYENRELRAKLAEYEQAEKDGQLVVLPCKGDKLFYRPYADEPNEYRNNADGSGIVQAVQTAVKFNNWTGWVPLSKTSTTREAAEAAMKGAKSE